MISTAPAILANDFRALWREIGADAEAALRRVGESGWFVLGTEVREFEKELAAFWGLGEAIGCGNGMDAIFAVNRLPPTTRILAISGGGKNLPAEGCLRVAKGLGADALLLLPFGREQFIEAVSRAATRLP